jgi:uncharacterized protein (TIGR02271 family)
MSEVRRVLDQNGIEGVIETQDERSVRVRWSNGRSAIIPRDALVLEQDAYRVQIDLNSRYDEQTVIPLVAEQLTVDKETLEQTVRVQKRVREETVLVDEALRHDAVEVERVPVNRYVDQPLAARTEGDTMIIPVFEEVLIVEKRLLLREEIRITRRQTVERAAQEYVLRREEATVTRDNQ